MINIWRLQDIMRTDGRIATALTLAATAWLAYGSTALAEEARIRGQIHGFLADLFLQDTQKLKIGPIAVGPASQGRHPVSVNGISAHLGKDAEDEEALRLALPQFALTAQPLGEDRLRLTHVSMPDGLSILTAQGKRVGTLNAAGAKAVGTWAADLGSAINVDITMDQLRFAFDGRELPDNMLVFAHAEKAVLKSEDSFDAKGLWTSNGTGRLTGIDLGTDQDGRITLGELAVSTLVGGLRPDALLQLEGLITNPDALDGNDWVDTILREGLLDGLKLETSLKDMAISAAGSPGTVRVGRLAQGLTLADLRSDAGAVGLVLVLEGLSVPAEMLPDAKSGRFLPSTVSLDMTLQGLPGRTLGETAAKLESEGNSEMFQLEAMGILTAAPIRLALNALRLDAAGMSITATGGLDAAPDSAMGFTGKVEVLARGLTEAMGELATLPPSEFKQNALTALAVFLGNAEPQQDGSMRALFEFGRDGAMTVNGRPLDLPK